MANIRTIKGVPGGLNVDGQNVVLTEVYDGYKWDTVAVHNSGAAIASGQQFLFFRDLDDKNLIDTNVTQQRRISRGEEMEIKTIGAHVSFRTPAGTAANISAQDFEWAITRLYLLLRINKKDVAEGPLHNFPAGLGSYGQSAETNGKVLSNGVPASASVRPLYKTISINSDHDIEGIMTHYAAGWLTTYTAITPAAATNAVLVRLLLGGRIKSGITRG